MAEDILGISAHMDISDIQKSFERLSSDLDKLGVKTDEVSARMTKALDDISKSAGTDTEKTKQSIAVLKGGLEEIGKSLSNTPDSIKRLASEATAAENAVSKLQEKLAKTAQGTEDWEKINAQLQNQQKLASQLSGEYNSLLGTFGSTQQYMGTLNSAIETLNAGRSISTATTAASATAHGLAATAVATESIAHADNSTKIADETEKINLNTEAVKNATNEAKGELSVREGLIQKINQHKAAMDDLLAKQTEQSRISASAASQYEGSDAKANGTPFSETSYGQQAEDASHKIEILNDKVVEHRVAIKELQAALKELDATRTASQSAQEVSKTKEETEAIRQKKAEIAELKAEYQKYLELAKQMKSNPSDFNLIQEIKTFGFNGSGGDFGKLKEQIAEAEAELQKMQKAAEDASHATDAIGRADKNELYEAIKGMEEDLADITKKLKETRAAYGKNSDEAKKLEQQQKELNKDIYEAKDRLKQMGTSYKEVSEQAKAAEKATKKLGQESENASKKVGGIFSKLKGSLSDALKGNFSGLFGFVGKIGAWGAALAAIGKGLYDLTVRAEKFRAALQPLSHYIDGNALQSVRQNILAMSSDTTKSVEDMAKAATQFVKVWDSLRNSPEALTQMVKASNEFGALSGQSSEEAAKALSNLASMYHLTGRETTEVSSIVANASKNTTSSFGEMAGALESAGHTASTYGVSFRDMATLIGYSANNFGGASQAASKFSMLLMTMSNMQKEYNPTAVGMVKALENLKEAYDRGEPVQDKFMKRNRSAAMYFINNAKAISDYSKGIDDNTAKNNLLADANAKASVNVEKLKNAWNGFLTSINANLTPILTRVLGFLTKLTGGITETADEINYLSNFDKRHKSTTRAMMTSYGVGMSTTMNGPDVATYRKQRDRLYAYYDRVEKELQKKYPNISSKALATGANNATLAYFRQRQNKEFSAIASADFNDLMRGKRSATVALSATPTNSQNPEAYSTKDETTEKARKYREEQAEQTAKLLADTKKQEWELYVATAEEAIAKEYDASEKELKQRALDFEKRKHAIEEQAEQMRQVNIAAAKAEYEKNPANAKKEGFYASGLDKTITLNEAQQKTINAKTNLLNAQYLAEQEKNLKAITDKYKTEVQERADLEKQFNADIEKIQKARAEKEKELQKASTDEQKAQLEKEISNLVSAEARATKNKGEALMGFDFEQLKKNPEYVQAFEDLGNVSNKTLTHLIELFEQFKEKAAESMSPEKIREYTSTLQSMQDELLGRGNPFSQLATASAEYSSANAEVKALEKKVNLFKKGKWAVNDMTTAEKKLTDAYDTQEKAEEALRKAKDKRNKAENKQIKSIKNLHEKINELASAINGLGSTIGGTEGEILSLIAGVLTFVTQTTESIKLVAATGAQALSTLEKASVILTVISAAIQILQKISSLYKDSHAQYEEYAEKVKKVSALTNSINEYKLAVISANQAEKNWFATSGLTNLRDAAETNLQVLQSYMDAVAGAQAIYEDESGGGWLTNSIKWIGKTVSSLLTLPGKLVTKGLEAMGLNMDTWFGKVVDWTTDIAAFGSSALVGKGIAAALNSDNYTKGTTAAYNNLRIETRKKSKGFLGSGLGGHSQKTKDLREWAKENYGEDLFDENYWINTELANQILEDYGDKLVGETKETLETLIELKEKYDEFVEEIEDYVSEMYSPLVDNLTDALFDWLDTGEDVMAKFKEYSADTFRDIAKDFVKTLILQDGFNTYKEKLAELYKMYSLNSGMTEEQLANSVASLTKNWMSEIETKIPSYQSFLQGIDKGFSDAGVDITEQSQQSATSKAIEAITEDQADTLTGIGYAMQIALEQGNATRSLMQIDVTALRTTVDVMSLNITEMRDIQYQGLTQLETISKNTLPISVINETITSMYKLMKERY